MKITLAIAALIGLASFEEVQAITVYTTSGAVAYVEECTDSSDSSCDEDVQMVQLGGDDSESDHSKEYFPAGTDEMLGDSIIGEYKRVIPARFAEDTDDIFMRSVIQDFSTEGEVGSGPKEGEPTGVFTLNEAQAKAVGSAVLSTKKGITGEALAEYLGLYWAKTWRHYDVNQSGNIPVGYAPLLARFLANDQSLQL